MLHPIDNFTVELFLDGDVSHGRGRSGTMPVLFTGGEPNDITRTDVLDEAMQSRSKSDQGDECATLCVRLAQT
jgi:hypothetical protein